MYALKKRQVNSGHVIENPKLLSSYPLHHPKGWEDDYSFPSGGKVHIRSLQFNLATQTASTQPQPWPHLSPHFDPQVCGHGEKRVGQAFVAWQSSWAKTNLTKHTCRDSGPSGLHGNPFVNTLTRGSWSKSKVKIERLLLDTLILLLLLLLV